MLLYLVYRWVSSTKAKGKKARSTCNLKKQMKHEGWYFVMRNKKHAAGFSFNAFNFSSL